MGTFIVDFQAFKDDSNNFILKEIVIVSVDSHIFTHCIAKPPFHLNELSSKKQREVCWLTEKYHGINWKEGYIKLEDVIQLLQDLTQNASLILSKGLERKKLLEKVTRNPTLDLDEILCPPAKRLPDADSYYMCAFSKHSANDIQIYGYVCSVVAAFKYKSWYLEYLNNSMKILPSLPKPKAKEDNEYNTT